MADPVLHEVAVLYAYHDSGRNRATVENFYGRIVRDNPGVPVVPLTCGYPPWLPGTVDVEPLETVWLTQEESGQAKGGWLWSHCDQIYWRYLRSPGRVEAERYVLFDWDVMSNGMSVREFYGSRWDDDCCGLIVHTFESHRKWDWWTPEILDFVGKKNARGVVPTAGTLLSRKAADCLARTTPPDALRPAFCEAYFPNLLVLNGFSVVAVSGRRDVFGVYNDSRRNLCRGVHHPVKHHSATFWPHNEERPVPRAAPRGHSRPAGNSSSGHCFVVPTEDPPGPHNITKKLRNP